MNAILTNSKNYTRVFFYRSVSCVLCLHYRMLPGMEFEMLQHITDIAIKSTHLDSLERRIVYI